MLHVTFETMEDEETTILAEKSTILDGRRRENMELKPPQPPSWGWGSGWGLSSAKTRIGEMHLKRNSP